MKVFGTLDSAQTNIARGTQCDIDEVVSFPDCNLLGKLTSLTLRAGGGDGDYIGAVKLQSNLDGVLARVQDFNRMVDTSKFSAIVAREWAISIPDGNVSCVDGCA